MKLPRSFKQYFWDVDFEELDPKKNHRYIIVRLLDHGDIKAIQYLFKIYPKALIKEVVIKYRGLSAKTANFWASYFNIDPKMVPSLKNPYSYKPIWFLGYR